MRNKPGVEWAYCTFGFVLLGEIITRVLGRNVYDFIEKEILEPCGMKDSFFPDHPLRNEAEREARIAALKRFNVRDAAKEKEVAYLLAVASGEKKPKPSPFDGVPMTGSNLVSTAQDLNRFGVMLLNNGTIDGKRILGRRTVTRMTENYTNQGIQDFCWNAGGAYRMYGLGPDTRRTADSLYSDGTFFHEGAGACSLIIDPEERLVASWFVPFSKPNAWLPHGLYSASAIMWSGLK
jgi:CubicO group peptidase (beta-lactamase class C family)